MKRLNRKLFFSLLATFVLLGAGLAGLHAVQSGRIARALLWQARRAQQKGDLARAVRYLARYLEFVPGDSEQRARLGLALANPRLAKDYQGRENALFVLEQVVNREPGRHDLRRTLARIAIEMGRFDLARAHLGDLERHFPADAGVQDLLGRWHEAREDLAGAKTCYQKAVALAPGTTKYRVRLALLLRQRLHQSADAEPVVAEALRRDPTDAAALLLAANLAQDRGDLAGAGQILKRGLGLHPRDANFYKAQAGLEIHRDRRPQAIACLRRGLEILPPAEHADLRWTLANLLLDVNADREARAEIARLRQANFHAGAVQYLDARLRLCRSEWAGAAGVLERVRPKLEDSPELSTQVDLFLGRCYEQLDDMARRFDAYSRAVRRDPRSAVARRGLGATLWTRGQLLDALDQYRQLENLPDVPPDAWTEYARLVLDHNRQAEQPDWKDFDRVLALARKADPKSVEAVLLRAEALRARNQFDQAEGVLAEAQKDRPTRVEFWKAQVVLAEARGNVEKAGRLLELAEQTLEDRVELRLVRANLLASRDGQAAAPALAKLAGGIERFTPREQADLLTGLAEASYRTGDAGTAARLLRRVADMKSHAQDLRLRLRLFDVALQAGDEAAVSRTLQEMRRLEGEAGAWWRFGRATFLTWQVRQSRPGRDALLTEAHQLLDEVATQRPAWSAVPLAKAQVADLRGERTQASAYYRQALELGENNQQVVRQLVAQGQALADRGERSFEAEERLRRAVDLAPGAAESWVSLLRYQLATGQRQEAETTLARVERHFKQSGTAPLVLAQCYEAVGKLDEAEKQYREALAGNPDVAAFRSAACFYLRRNLPKNTEALLRSLLDRPGLKPTGAETAWARRALAVVLADGSDYARFREALRLVGLAADGAGKISEEVKPPAGERDDVLRARARVLASQGGRAFRAGAVGLLEDLGRRGRLAPDDQFLLAQLHEARGDAGWPRARELLGGLAGGAGKRPQFLAHYAQSLLLRKDVAEAEQWISRLEQMEKTQRQDFGAAECRARALELRGRDDEARAVLTAYAAATPVKAERVLALAGFLARRNRLKEALDQCERAWAVAPPEMAGGASVALLRTSAHTDADCARVEARLKAALEKDPDSVVLQVQLADLEDLRGRFREAEALYRKVLKRGPNAMALNNLAWLLAHRPGQGKEALALIEKAIAQLGPRAELLDTRAVVHLALGNSTTAIADLEKAIGDAPSPSRYFHLARAFRSANQTDAALQALRKAKTAGLELKRLHPAERVAYREITDELDQP